MFLVVCLKSLGFIKGLDSSYSQRVFVITLADKAHISCDL